MRALASLALALSLAACSPIVAESTSSSGRLPATAKPLPEAPPPPPLADEQRMCTADAKLCADGSYVSRDSTRGCAFKPCPGASTP